MDYQNILDYWFGDLKNNDYFPARKAKIWYRKNPETDKYIRNIYMDVWELAANNQLLSWQNSIRGKLATIIVLDQFSRHIFRDTPKAYSQDQIATKICLQILQNNEQHHLFTVEKAFLYMPLQHSENLELQKKSVAHYQSLANKAHPKIREQMHAFCDYAFMHHKTIERFGRFPHRNKILERLSTEDEISFLQKK